jgi:hypothetical protein
MSSRGCPHSIGAAKCYSCATGKPRKLTPDTLEAHASPVTVYRDGETFVTTSARDEHVRAEIDKALAPVFEPKPEPQPVVVEQRLAAEPSVNIEAMYSITFKPAFLKADRRIASYPEQCTAYVIESEARELYEQLRHIFER